MKKTTCNVYLCKIHFIMAFIGVLLRTWTQILRKSLFNGSFLQSWKKAVIRLLIKSCELHRELKKYQLISNFFFISKCKALLLQLSTFFGDQNLLCTYQSALYKHHWTETVVCNICDAILDNAECNNLTGIVCLDLNVAFDTVHHSILKTGIEHCFGLNY